MDKSPTSVTSDSSTMGITASDRRLSVIAWTTAAMLLGFLCLTHLGVLLHFLTSHAALPFVAPVALAGALLIGDRLGRREGLSGRMRLWPVGLTFVLTVLAVAVSAAFYDLSWDGQWYHQVAIYRLAEGWNPLKNPMQSFVDDINLWIRHYAKGPWYASAAVMATTGYIESGKFVTWIALDATFLAIFAACLDAGMRRRRAMAVSALVGLNPVVTVQMVVFMVDGLMICYLACYTAALFSGFRRAGRLVVFVGAAAAICSINSKLTGLVFLCFVTAGAGFYCLLRRRDLFWRFVGLNLGTIVLATVAFGYNPYVTNMIHRGHPFYPYMGTKAYPSLAAQGNEGIEKYETPKNMLGRNRIVRHALALFGKPGVQPYNDGENATWMWPFLVPLKNLVVYHTHEIRVAGFGPFFSGALLISLLLTAWLMFSPGLPRGLVLLAYVTVILSLLVSLHTWWARYGPQMWWIPLLPVIAVFGASRCRGRMALAWVLVAILLINALAVAVIHFHWEITASRTLDRQLTQLRDSGKAIDVDFQWFGEAVGKRFTRWGISYTRVRRGRANDGPELMTVVAGYPGTIHYKVKDATPPVTLNQTPGQPNSRS
jgi:hypothetical protein